MDLDEDPDPEMPPSGTLTHPIDISSGSSFVGSPYKGPDEYNEWWGQWKFANTPSYHNTPPQPPLEEPHFEAVTPPPLPAEEPPQPPPEPPRRRRNARISVRGGPRFSSPQASSNYPLIPEDPQMGGPSHVVPEIDVTPATFAPSPPPMGYENPIPTYPGPTGYNLFEPQAPTGYNYQPPTYDLYIEAVNYNALYPSPFPPAYPTGYPVQGYNTLHLNPSRNLNHHNNKKSCKGCKKWNVGWIEVKGTPISSLKDL
ncbi:leucine-rich repeat extensin-like protein 2 [Helianthus annuus]|uniref:leucine-rich repeat extensin-like protein 2 n=1 Tax=Helianthus annuus TaxID=4232 RepID=UPI000B8F9CA9|nr:leucine-rich repeat extensin-like protein 2 [Helianthus annuus]